MAEKTKARQIAEKMEKQRRSPATTGLGRMLDEADENEVLKDKPMLRGAAKGVTLLATPAAVAMDAVTKARKKPRSEEEISELTREVAKGMKKGGSVKSSASKRADGCAVKGKTRGKMV